jgi:xanthine dehydrogenase YagR molybdenum-binding subunit
VISHTSEFEDFSEPSAKPTRMLYTCLNVGTPTFLRAPGEATGTFALEVAMDELAYALAMDPVEPRLRNYAEADPESGRPWSSKHLRECYRGAAARFGWARALDDRCERVARSAGSLSRTAGQADCRCHR